jgi:hypothetical protein
MQVASEVEGHFGGRGSRLRLSILIERLCVRSSETVQSLIPALDCDDAVTLALGKSKNEDVTLTRSSCSSQRYLGNRLSGNPEVSTPYVCFAGSYDQDNNVEVVRFSASGGSTFTVKVMFTSAGQSTQNFSLAVRNGWTGTTAPPTTPTGFSVSASSSTTRSLAWNSVSGAAGYDQAPVSFTDPALTPTASVITATHIEELRSALALTAERLEAGRPAFLPTDPVFLLGAQVRAVHIQELRDEVK